jgi:hypothetical protein
VNKQRVLELGKLYGLLDAHPSEVAEREDAMVSFVEAVEWDLNLRKKIVPAVLLFMPTLVVSAALSYLHLADVDLLRTQRERVISLQLENAQLRSKNINEQCVGWMYNSTFTHVKERMCGAPRK